MILKVRMFLVICLVVSSSITFGEDETTSLIKEIKQEISSHFKESVVQFEPSLPPKELSEDRNRTSFSGGRSNYFRKYTIQLDGQGSIEEQIVRREIEWREGVSYTVESYAIVRLTGMQNDWKDFVLEKLLTIEKDRAENVIIPHFCRVFNAFEGTDADEITLNKCRAELRKILSPLPRRTSVIPLYYVEFLGNYLGNNKYSKLYVGNLKMIDGKLKESPRYLVLDVSVYDHI